MYESAREGDLVRVDGVDGAFCWFLVAVCAVVPVSNCTLK